MGWSKQFRVMVTSRLLVVYSKHLLFFGPVLGMIGWFTHIFFRVVETTNHKCMRHMWFGQLQEDPTTTCGAAWAFRSCGCPTENDTCVLVSGDHESVNMGRHELLWVMINDHQQLGKHKLYFRTSMNFLTILDNHIILQNFLIGMLMISYLRKLVLFIVVSNWHCKSNGWMFSCWFLPRFPAWDQGILLSQNGYA